jgi:hypothetical protein
MRDRDTIDAELRRLAALRREQGIELSTRQLDALLDERLGHAPAPSETGRVEARAPNAVRPYRLNGVLRRFTLLAALPLSLIGVTAALVVMFTAHNPPPAAQPAEVPPPSSSARPNPVPPKAQPPPVDIVDTAFVDALKQENVPIPSREYVISHGHAVCDFLARQPNFGEAIHFVQQSSIWDANQSAYVTAGAIISYCPQYQAARTDQMRQAPPDTLPGLQNIQGDLEGIEGVLQGIRDDLQAIPGQQ